MPASNHSPPQSTTSAKLPIDFGLYRDYWTTLWVWCGRLEALPETVAEFSTRYGSLDDPEQVENFVAAVAQARAAAAMAGNPTLLEAELVTDPGLLTGSATPSTLYAQIVRLVRRMDNIAGTFKVTLEQLPTLTTATSTGRQIAASVKEVLCARDGGLTSQQNSINAFSRPLIGNIALVEDQFNQAYRMLEPSQVLNLAHQSIGALNGQLERLKTARDKAQHAASDHHWWSSSSEQEARQKVAQLETEIDDVEQQLAQKRQLSNDLDGFFEGFGDVIPALMNSGYLTEKVQQFLADSVERLTSVCQLATPDQLSDAAWLAGALDLPTALSDWQQARVGAEQFVRHSLVTLAKP